MENKNSSKDQTFFEPNIIRKTISPFKSKNLLENDNSIIKMHKSQEIENNSISKKLEVIIEEEKMQN